MKTPVQVRLPQPSDGRGAVAGKARSTPKASRHVRRNEAMLEIGEGVFSDEAIQGLVDNLIIPMIVEEMIKAATGRRDPNYPIDMTG